MSKVDVKWDVEGGYKVDLSGKILPRVFKENKII
jgi:hypothetical protein